MKISKARLDALAREGAEMLRVREPWLQVWRDVSNYFLPRRYVWLPDQKETKSARQIRNTLLMDGTTCRALRTLSTGLMNGISSPIRPWFRLQAVPFHTRARKQREVSFTAKVWLEDAVTTMHRVMSESNFYNALGILYVEWAAFGTASMGIYEDFEDVIRCYNYAIGEFAIASDHTRRVRKHYREFEMTAEQISLQFPLGTWSEPAKSAVKNGADQLHKVFKVCHLVAPAGTVPELSLGAPFVEIYWEKSSNDGSLLSLTPAEEFPNICPRWEIYGSDDYGTSECMNAIPDVLQLNQMIKRRGQALDLAVRPPMIFKQTLQHVKRNTTSGGETFTSEPDLTQAARPLFTVQVPFDQLNADIQMLQGAIKEQLYNHLFMMISQLQTVRSATEVDARREEVIIQIGPVLERFDEEGIGQAVSRVFQICLRRGMFPPMPEELRQSELTIQYVGVLSDAQRAIGTIPIERYLQILGNLLQAYPDEVREVPNIEEIFRGYGEAIGLPEKFQRPREETESLRQQRQQQQNAAAAAAQAEQLAGGAQQLSNTDLGGGVNALQAMLGGV